VSVTVAWISIIVSIIIASAGIIYGMSATKVQDDVKYLKEEEMYLKAEIYKLKTQNAVISNDLKYIRESLNEIKAILNKEKTEKLY